MKQYIGARYVPVWQGDHDRTKAYEATDIVTSGVQEYIAIRPVPPGIYINNTLYWHPYGGVTKIFAIAPNTIEIPFYTYYSQATVVMVNKPDVDIEYTTTGPIDIEVFGDNIIITPSAPGLATITADAADGQTATCAVTVIDEQYERLDYLQLTGEGANNLPLGFYFGSQYTLKSRFIPETANNFELLIPSGSNQPGQILFKNSSIIYRYGNNQYLEVTIAPYAVNGDYVISINLPHDVENEYKYSVNEYVVVNSNFGASGNVEQLGHTAVGKLFYFQLLNYDTQEIVEELVPARNLLDNTLGLLSTVTRAFIEVPYSSAPVVS